MCSASPTKVVRELKAHLAGQRARVSHRRADGGAAEGDRERPGLARIQIAGAGIGETVLEPAEAELVHARVARNAGPRGLPVTGLHRGVSVAAEHVPAGEH